MPVTVLSLPWLRCGPAVLLGDLEADQVGRARGRALGGQVVVEAGQDPGRRAPGDQPPRTASRGHIVAGPQVVGELARRLRGHVVEEFPVHHHYRRVLAGRVALEVLKADLTVRRDLVVAHAEVLAEFGE